MKKIVLLLAILMLASFAMSSCGEPSTTPSDSGTPGVQDDRSNLGYCNVVIESYRFDTYKVNYNPEEKVLIVKYIFTNNNNESESFFMNVNPKVYQNGVSLKENSSYFLLFADDSTNYDNCYAEIKPGATVEVELAYTLRDEISDLEIEVVAKTYNGNVTNEKVTKTFKIAK